MHRRPETRKAAFLELGAAVCAAIFIGMGIERVEAQSNTPPTLSNIADQAVYPNLSSPPILLSVGDAETAADDLVLSASSSDTNLLPLAAMIFGGSESNRTLTLTPVPNQRGTSVVTVVVSDLDGGSVSNAFTLRVEEFSVLPTGAGMGYGAGVVWGDYDNDGYLDLVYGGTVTRVFHNRGDGSIESGYSSFSYYLYFTGANWVDYDRDGRLDLALAGTWAGMYRNAGNGTFPQVSAFSGLDSMHMGSWSFGDYNNDGSLDALLAGEDINYNTVGRLYRNNGAGLLERTVNLVGVEGPGQLIDLDRDGDLDVVLIGFSLGNGDMTAVYRNDGGGSFVGVDSGLPRVRDGQAMAWADYDQDGLPDVFLAGSRFSAPSVSDLFRNVGSNTFVAVTAGFPTNTTPVAWGDFDSDGFPDLLAGTGDGMRLFRSNRNGTFTDIGINLPGAAAFADYDNDGDLDIVDNLCANIYRNNSSRSNSPPTAPVGVTSTVSLYNDVQLSWSPSTDSETTNSRALTYNLRMGTTPGGIDVITPQANVTNGFRRVVRSGDILTNTWTMIDVPRGTYYWSVQAIDPAFAGSPFSAEGSFAITNARPFIFPITDRAVSHIAASLTVNFTNYDAETPASNLVVTVSSSNTNVISNDRLQFNGAGANRSLTIYPAVNLVGASTITLTAQDEAGATFTRPFVVTVTNALPTITSIAAQTIPMNGATPALAFTVGDLETAVTNLVVTAKSSNLALVPDDKITLGGTGASRTVAVTPLAYQSGATTITLTVTDASGGSKSMSFTVTVTQFSDMAVGLPALQDAGLAWGDFDNDEQLDILVAGSGMTRLYRNTGSNSFALVAGTFPAVTNGACAWGDLDNDGNLDFVVLGSGLTRLYRNNGNGTFTNWPVSLPGLSLGSVAWGDYDVDGHLDLLIAGSTSASTNTGITRVYRNNGDGTFTDMNVGLAGVCRGSVAWGDYNSDGYADILLAGYCGKLGSNICRIYRNDGNGVFTQSSVTLPGISSGSAAWGDYDGDGRLDVALTGSTNVNGTGGILRVFRNLGNDSFQNIGPGSDDLSGGMAAWSDFDNDGALDLIAIGNVTASYNTPRTKFYLNNRNGTLSAYAVNVPAFYTGSFASGDYDKDGDLDFLIAGKPDYYTSGITRLFRNNLAFTNTPPTVPQDLAANVLSNHVALSWSPAQDSQTTNAAGLRYVVRIGSSPGAVDVRSPLAAPVGGYRRVPEPVGGVVTNVLLLPHLHKGTYYWSVQTVDSSLAGSAFASESTFTVTNDPPWISSVADQATTPNVGTNIVLAVWDTETSADELILTGYSLNTNLVPNEAIVFGGVGTNRTVSIAPTNNLTGVAPIIVQVTDTAGATASTRFNLTVEMFPLSQTNLIAVQNGTAAWGDYDNDGFLDVLIAGNNRLTNGSGLGRVTRLYHNNGDATFSQVATPFPGIEFGSAAWGDYDNDGYLDLLLTGTTNGNSSGALARIYRNLGNGVFANTVSLLAVYQSAAAWFDFNNDGRLDLVLTGTTSGVASGARTRIYRNDSNGVFTFVSSLTEIYQGAVACGDCDNDGYVDLLFSGLNNSGVAGCWLYRNLGTGSFSPLTPPFPGVYNASLAWGDYNNDGYLDIFVAGTTSGQTRSNITRIYRNLGNRFFTDIQAGLTPIQQGTVAWGDLDNDGYLDAVATGTTALNPGTNTVDTLVKVYRNNRSGGFAEMATTLQGVHAGGLILGDANNDRRLDVLLSGSDGTFGGTVYNPILRLHRNATSLSNSPPHAPTNLLASVSGRDVSFSWSRSSDLETTNALGLGYTLRVGTTSGGNQIVAPPAVASTGLRRLPCLGGVRSNSGRLLNLLPGTYHWSVQAVDQSFAGSAFSEEAVFVVTNHAPSASSQFVVLAEDTATTITLSGSEQDGQTLSYSVVVPPVHGTLSGASPNLVYQPHTNYFGVDAFIFTANDGMTDSPPATVTLIITSVSDGTPASLTASLSAAGQFQLLMAGEPYERYGIEASTDLQSWVPLTNFTLADVPMGFVDLEAGLFPQRFYRSAWIAPTAQAATPVLLSPSQFQFTVAGEPGRIFLVSVSTNLVDWSPMWNLVLTNTSTLFVDPAASNFPGRFYRLSLP